jgi:hypothetical protein
MSRALPILLAIVLSGGFLGFVFVQAVRQEPDSTAIIPPVRKDILSTDVTAKINAREVNGQIPVQVTPESFGRDDPFANF